jgi:hypothetical protein
MTDADDGRRRFLMLMGLACASTTLAALAPGANAAAADAAGAKAAGTKAAESIAAAPTPPPAPATEAQPKAPSTEARSLGEAVRARWPGRLDDAQQAALVQDLDDRLEGGRALRKLPLANGDEPDFEFHA